MHYALKNRFMGGIIIVLAVVAMALLASCSEVLVTDRSRTLLLSEKQLVAMSAEQYNQLLSESELSKNPEYLKAVARVGHQLVSVVDSFLKQEGYGDLLQYYDWEFNVIKDDEMLNAFCLPGGKIAVYTGMFKVADIDSELAVVMAHEIAHALAQHGNERMSQQLIYQLGAQVLTESIDTESKEVKQIYNTVYGVGATLGVLLPYSRVHEKEADRIGMVMMARAGYNPKYTIIFWNKLNEQSSNQTPEFLSTHPSPTERMKDIKEFMPQAMEYYKPAK